MKTKYRIAEFGGKFRIQIYAYEIKGILWWRKKVWSWENTNSWGGCRQYYPLIEPGSKEFDKLSDARSQIKSWHKGTIIHKP